jgi:hypothetical protein
VFSSCSPRVLLPFLARALLFYYSRYCSGGYCWLLKIERYRNFRGLLKVNDTFPAHILLVFLDSRALCFTVLTTRVYCSGLLLGLLMVFKSERRRNFLVLLKKRNTLGSITKNNLKNYYLYSNIRYVINTAT